MDASRPSRRRFRFSLRTLLVSVTIVSGVFGLLGAVVRGALLQRHAAQTIRNRDGIVLYDYQYRPSGYRYDVKSPVPEWLRDIAGDDWYVNIVEVNYDHRQISDEALACLQGLPRLSRLRLARTAITDDGLVLLQNLPRLEYLYLYKTEITDAGLAHLAKLRRLKDLNLAATQITDAGLWQLRNMTQLESLDLQQTEISDAGLVHLHGLKLWYLCVHDTKVTERGCQELEKLLPDLQITR